MKRIKKLNSKAATKKIPAEDLILKAAPPRVFDDSFAVPSGLLPQLRWFLSLQQTVPEYLVLTWWGGGVSGDVAIKQGNSLRTHSSNV